MNYQIMLNMVHGVYVGPSLSVEPPEIWLKILKDYHLHQLHHHGAHTDRASVLVWRSWCEQSEWVFGYLSFM